MLRKGDWWGNDFAALVNFLTNKVSTFPIEGIVQARCSCGCTIFSLVADRSEGCAKRICINCNQKSFICNSQESWSEARPKKIHCVCRSVRFEIGVGISPLNAYMSNNLITIGQRCIECGLLTNNIDWTIYSLPMEVLIGLV